MGGRIKLAKFRTHTGMATPTRPLAVPAVPKISEPLAVVRSLLAASKGAGAADVMRHFRGEPVRYRRKGVR